MESIDHFSLPRDLELTKIQGLPSTAYYIPNFVSQQEERVLLDKIATAPKPRWKQLTRRRLQTWPSDLIRDRLLDAPLPRWLEEPVVSRILSLSCSASIPDDDHTIEQAITLPHHIFARSPHQRPNHVLVNEYSPGVGIMAHKMAARIGLSMDDGALDPTPVWRILQEPRSLLITADDLYTAYLHGIADADEDVDLSPDTIVNWSLLRDPLQYAQGRNHRQTRTSLTYRDVLKVSKMGNRLDTMFKR
ncbi:uncharacterized protein UV8b_02888 [Ustilaginoidea virens]|uniref:Calpain n=1 Tax=Ustilaginoidea virens TaxID=1159556 RepID=A0A8E5MG96_USTVR|nr:uncharacterized protein UV8b_02888 [Ustilaginoidea virens]QUC18647.1 hypothetical protein UV8b_02888 [Ustilaginoidea virens]